MDQTLRKYYLSVKEKPCLACGKPSSLAQPSEADHIKPWSDKLKNFGLRSHKGLAAYFCVPLCRECHQERHQHPEEEWYESKGWPRDKLYAYLAHQLASFLAEEGAAQNSVIVRFMHRIEYNTPFMRDIQAMCARLGIDEIVVIPLNEEKGDYASNVPGYGNFLWEFIPFSKYDNWLALSWRFISDPDFRREELPKLEAAMAKVLKGCT